MVLIAVHGSASRFLPAERGTVRLSLGAEHDDRAVALRAVEALHERFAAEAATFVHAGAATWWGSDQVRVQPEHRYREDGGTHRVVQVAAAEVRVRFRDFGALSGWVESAGSDAGVTIGGIAWTLTEQRRAQVQREVRVAAVQEAVRRAEAYAGALGGAVPVLEALWEPGLRPHAGEDAGVGGTMLRSMAAADAGSGLQLRPDDIEVEAAVTADFRLDLPA